MGHKFHMVKYTAIGWKGAGFGICLPLCSPCIKILSLKEILRETEYTMKWKMFGYGTVKSLQINTIQHA